MKFATRNASAVLAAGALLATAPVSASLPELSGERPLAIERPLEIIEVVEKMIEQPADAMLALQQIRVDLDESLMQHTKGALLDAVRTGFESARVARETVERAPDDEREEVATELSRPDAIRLSALEITDDSDSRVLSF